MNNDGPKPWIKSAGKLGCTCQRAKLNEKGEALFEGMRVWVIDKDCQVHNLAPPPQRKNTLH